ncbi:MAG: hypothetical protein ACYDBB_02145 [Armatimonadota bacterium]
MSRYRQHLSEIKREARFGRNACCPICGYAALAALVQYRNTILCYECMLEMQGKSPIELHHVFGRSKPDVVPLPGNLHRIITAYGILWDFPTVIEIILYLILWYLIKDQERQPC